MDSNFWEFPCFFIAFGSDGGECVPDNEAVWNDASQMTLVAFHPALACQLVNNTLLQGNDIQLICFKRTRNLGVLHDLENASKQAEYFDGGKWNMDAKPKCSQ